MERSEPALVPEWLRSTRIVNGGGSSAQLVASSLDPDVSSFSKRNSYSRSNSDKDITRPPFLDRSSSSNSRQISGGNNLIKHPYSSFARNPRDRNHERDRNRSIPGELWDRDSSDPLQNILTCSVDKNSLKRSQSLVPRRFDGGRTEESTNNARGDLYTGIDTLSGGSMFKGTQKDSFKSDLFSLGAEEKQVESGIRRSSSSSWSSAVQNSSIGSSGLSGGENWTSALADAPNTTGSNTMVNSSTQHIPIVNVSTGVSAGLNMAEALSKAPSHLRSNLVPDKSQRLEELAVKQSRQLIPMTPSTPKALAPNSLEKLKRPKVAVKANDTTVARSVQQQHATQPANQARGGQIKSDILNASHSGKFLVLKPGRETGASLTAKDGSSPTNNTNGKIANGQFHPAPPSRTGLAGNSNLKGPIIEKKAGALTLNSRPAERKSSSQAQSRSDFFNLMRKKTSMNSSSVAAPNGAIISPSSMNNDENTEEANVAPVSPQAVENHTQILANGDSDCKDDAQKNSSVVELNVCPDGAVFPDEEEAAFLRSLGWEENEEEEGLTEEEINAFYENVKVRPALNIGRGIERDCCMLSGSHTCSKMIDASSES